ncbi:MAG: DUF4147 domain-containing protein [Acidobacteriota bacterium]
MAEIDQLLSIYREAVDACEPSELLLRISSSIPPQFLESEVEVVSIGKAAASLFRGASRLFDIARALVIVPDSYAMLDASKSVEVVIGGHPGMNADSFLAGRRLRQFVSSATSPVVFLVSGGSSACAEQALAPWFDERQVADLNTMLVHSGLPISSMNTIRKHVSALKGGRLGSCTGQPLLTLVYSDVATGDLASVGSGPTLPDPSTNGDAAAALRSLATSSKGLGNEVAAILDRSDLPETPFVLHGSSALIADNRTFVQAALRIARERFGLCLAQDGQMERDVETEAENLAGVALALPPGTLLVTGGEPTVQVRGQGRGGRCSELAVRLVRRLRNEQCSFIGLFAGSDGLDGNTGAAGVVVSSSQSGQISDSEFVAAIEKSDTFPLAVRMGEPIAGKATGNNLRDLVLIVRN